MSAAGEGVRLCEEALERLLAGKPNVSDHVGLPRHKITASIVSVEAGFVRGYLKSDRKSHMPLVARIEKVRGASVAPEASVQEQLRRSRNALERAEAEAAMAKKQLAAALSQNLMLLSQVKELEK